MPTKPPGKMSQRKQITALTHIHDHASYYDEKDAETYAIVQVSASEFKSPTWVKLQTILDSDISNWQIYTTYMQEAYSRGSFKTNIHYPLFAQINYQSEDNQIFPGIILSTDINNILTYKISIRDEDSPDGISSIDVMKDCTSYGPKKNSHAVL